MYQIARLLISISPVLMGVYLAFDELGHMAASNAAADWPKAYGTVTWVEYNASLYFPQSYISYDYEVNGNVYTGNRISFGDGAVSNYFRDQLVIVSYNPHNHNEAVLEAGLKIEHLFTLIIGVGLVIIGRVLWKRLE